MQPHHALVYPLAPTLQLEVAKRYAKTVANSVAALGLRPYTYDAAAEAAKLEAPPGE